jgi:hypothetical protein
VTWLKVGNTAKAVFGIRAMSAGARLRVAATIAGGVCANQSASDTSS